MDSILDEIYDKDCVMKIFKGTSAISECCICDENFLSNIYEESLLASIEVMHSLVGFFIYNKNDKLVVSSVINLPNKKSA